MLRLGESLSLTVMGAPRTKKNHGRIIRGKGGRPMMLPSKVWSDWCDAMAPALETAMQKAGLDPLAQKLNCQAMFYRDVDRGDAVGFYQGLADLLEHGGVVANDRWIVSWDGSQLLKDKHHPRVEIVLTALEAGQ